MGQSFFHLCIVKRLLIFFMYFFVNFMKIFRANLFKLCENLWQGGFT
jgi:hypothetical protein